MKMGLKEAFTSVPDPLKEKKPIAKITKTKIKKAAKFLSFKNKGMK